MRGAIAAGHPLTAEAGARVLAEGGTAVDACVAAGFASWVAESPLTGPGAGGFMLVHRARDCTTRLFDFFVNVPGLGGTRRRTAAMEEVGVDFTPESSQLFRIGAASCAVPGAPAGLEAAHRALGALPWRVLVEPAVALARGGVELTPSQAYVHAVLDPILRHTDEGRRTYGADGRPLGPRDRLVLSDLAETLERLGENGARELYHGDTARAIVRHVGACGGLITGRDLAEYRVIRRRPIRSPFLSGEFVSNPPPSTGGVLIAYGLRLFDRLSPDAAPGTAESLATLAEIMREQLRARGGRFARELYRGGLARRLFDDGALDEATARVRARVPARREAAGARGTTHISVVDGRGDAASLTASTGAGSGVIVPGTGIHLNNMVGEFDLSVTGGVPRPGLRMTSMMSPSLVLEGKRPRLVVGSAGSLRLRGAIMQIVVNVVAHGMTVEEAIERPRVHVEEPVLHCEGGHDESELARLEEWGYELERWRDRNLFFGGAAGVELREDGTLAAAGDPRRGGHGIVVE